MTKTLLQRRIRGIAQLGLSAAVIVVLTAAPVWACPNCKNNLDHQAGNLQLGFALSILLMLGSPLAIMSAWISWYFRYFRGAIRPLGFAENHIRSIPETTR